METESARKWFIRYITTAVFEALTLNLVLDIVYFLNIMCTSSTIGILIQHCVPTRHYVYLLDNVYLLDIVYILNFMCIYSTLCALTQHCVLTRHYVYLFDLCI